MGIVIVIVCLGAGLNLALWGLMFVRVDGLPVRVGQLVQRNRVADETRALEVLQAAAGARVGGIVIALQTHQEQLSSLVRAQVADAEVRARVSERRSSDAGVALSAASALVHELRGLLDELGLVSRVQVAPVPVAIDDGERPSEDELTTVGPRPALLTKTLASPSGKGGAA
jgi:hypothetical protein